MVEIFYTKEDLNTRINGMISSEFLDHQDPLIDFFPLYSIDTLCSLRIQVFVFYSDQFIKTLPNHNIIDFEKEWWPREAVKINECKKIIDYNDDITYVEKARLKSNLNFYSDIIELHMKPPSLPLTNDRKEIDARFDLVDFFQIHDPNLIYNFPDGTSIHGGRRECNLDNEDFSIIYKREFDKAESEYQGERAVQFEALFRVELRQRVSDYMSLYQQYSKRENQNLKLIFLANGFKNYLSSFEVTGSPEVQKPVSETKSSSGDLIKLITIEPEVIKALIDDLSKYFIEKEDKLNFEKALMGQKIENPARTYKTQIHIIAPFAKLITSKIITDHDCRSLAQWIHDSFDFLSARTKTNKPKSVKGILQTIEKKATASFKDRTYPTISKIINQKK